MPKELTEKSCYESAYGGGAISPAQYLTEVICARISKRDNKELPVKFWNNPIWAKVFKQQIAAANSLLKKYLMKSIMDALAKEKTAYSLRAPWLVLAIKFADEERRKNAPECLSDVEVKNREITKRYHEYKETRQQFVAKPKRSLTKLDE